MPRLRRLPTLLGALAVVTVGGCLVFDGKVASNDAGVGDATVRPDGQVSRIDASEDGHAGNDGALDVVGGDDAASDDAAGDGGEDDAGGDAGHDGGMPARDSGAGIDSGKDSGRDTGVDSGVDTGGGAICGANGKTVCQGGLKCCAKYVSPNWTFPTPACQASCADAGGDYDYACDTSEQCPPAGSPTLKICCAFREDGMPPPSYSTAKCQASCPANGIEICQPTIDVHGLGRACTTSGKTCQTPPVGDLPPDYYTCGTPP